MNRTDAPRARARLSALLLVSALGAMGAGPTDAGASPAVPLPQCGPAQLTTFSVTFTSLADSESELRVLAQGSPGELADQKGERVFVSDVDPAKLAEAATAGEPTLVILNSAPSESQFQRALVEAVATDPNLDIKVTDAGRLDQVVDAVLALKELRAEPLGDGSVIRLCATAAGAVEDLGWTVKDDRGTEVPATGADDGRQWNVSGTNWELSPAIVDAEHFAVRLLPEPPTELPGDESTTGSPTTSTSSTVANPPPTTSKPGGLVQDEDSDPAEAGHGGETDGDGGLPFWLVLVGVVVFGLAVGVGLGFMVPRRPDGAPTQRIAESPLASHGEPAFFAAGPIDSSVPLDTGSAATVVQIAPTSVAHQVASDASTVFADGALSGTTPIVKWLRAEWGWSEKIPGRGEDARPVVLSSGGGESFIAVADGLGGAGAAEVGRRPDGLPITSAQVGSNAVMEAVAGFAARGVSIDQMTPDAIRNAIRAKFDEKRAVYQEAAFGGSLVRHFPTTFASAAITRSNGQGVELRVMWVGDSRAYVLYPEQGLSVLTRDHVESDADDFELAHVDPKMNNVIEDRAEFRIDSRKHRITRACYVIVATDGVFGYLPTPRFLELSILQSRFGRLVNGQHAVPATSGLIRTVRTYAKDDASYALLAVGFQSPEAELAAIQPRLDTLYRELFELGPFATFPHGDPEFNRNDWLRYRAVYERFIRVNGNNDEA